MLLKDWEISTPLVPHTLFRSHLQSPHLFFLIWVDPQFRLSSSSCTSEPVLSPSTETLWDWGNKRLSEGICQDFWNILKSADRAIFAKAWMILSRIDEWCLMKCSYLDLNICLQQILKGSVRLQRCLKKKKKSGFWFFLFPPLPVLSSPTFWIDFPWPYRNF